MMLSSDRTMHVDPRGCALAVSVVVVLGFSAPHIASGDVTLSDSLASLNYTFNSPKKFDRGYRDGLRAMADVNGDGRADYCRFVGGPPESAIRLSCMLAEEGGFGGPYDFSAQLLDRGYRHEDDLTVVADVNGAGRAAYCRFVGGPPANDIFLSCGQLLDVSRWMELEGVADWTLSELVIPGTHDSGADKFSAFDSSCGYGTGLAGWVVEAGYDLGIGQPWARAQQESIAGQLRGGIRYFDLRPCHVQGRFRVHHDAFLAADFKAVLDELSAFMRKVERELVIINLSHFKPESFYHHMLIDLLKDRIGSYLHGPPPNLATTLGEYTRDGPRVLVVYEHKEEAEKHSGIWAPPKEWLKGSQPNPPGGTTEVAKLRQHQLEFLQSRRGKAGTMLIWTLTASPALIRKSLTPPPDSLGGPLIGAFKKRETTPRSLRDLSLRANRELPGFLAENWRRDINVLYVDHYQDARVTELAIAMNRITKPAPAPATDRPRWRRWWQRLRRSGESED